MATKNGVCPYCNFSRLENRVFPVNPEASTVFCPFCMRELSPKKSIGLYNDIIEKMLAKADNSLFVACDPAIAYKQYADVLEVEPYNSRALLGRILCLIYTSKVRRSYLVDAQMLLGNITHKGQEEVSIYVAALKKINLGLDEYETALNKKLSNHRNFFYDEDCLRLYLKHLYDIIKFKKEILKNLNEIRRDYITQRNDVLINMVSHSISEKELSLKTVKFTVQGKGYKLTKVVGDKAYVELSGDFVDIKSYKHRMYTLDPKDGSKKLINDLAFKDYTPAIRMKKASLALSIIFGVFGAAGIATAFIFMSDPLLFPILLAAGATFLAGSIAFVIVHLVLRRILKKRKLRIA